jgi:tetratricopeptide (TPR) repeat protein
MDASTKLSRAVAIAAQEAADDLQLGDKTIPEPPSAPIQTTSAPSASTKAKTDSEDHVLHAKTLHRAGNRAAAEQLYADALEADPDNADALHYLGLLRFQQGQGAAAVDLLYRAVAAEPETPEYYCNLGMVLSKSGRVSEALEVLDSALEIKPDYPEAYDHRGTALDRLGKTDEALVAWQKAVELRPDYAPALTHLARGFSAQGRDNEALELARKAVAINPGSGEANNQLGCSLRKIGELDQAAAAFRKATQLDPASPEAHSNLGTALYELGEIERSRIHLEKAIAIKPEYPEAHWNLALTLLVSGEFDLGWLEYEWRRPTYIKKNPPRLFTQPEWNGCSVHGRTILLVSEQGLGDTIQFVRYVPLLAQRGATVVLEAQPPLAEILRSVKGLSQIVAKGQPLPTFDVHARLMSLPGIFGTRLGDVPAEVPYIHSDPKREAVWKSRLAEPGFKIGIAWQGSKTFNTDRSRSIPLRHFEAIAAVDRVRLYSLQKNDGVEQIAKVADRFKVTEFDPPLDEGGSGAFMDTAAVMSQLDLVITSDTSIAHLAGAMGVRVWMPLNYGCDWRGLREREDSPWYPTMRLFRQETRDEWPSVFARIERILRDTLTVAPVDEPAPVLVPIAPGELLDRLSILQIKAQRVTDPVKLRRVQAELESVSAIRDKSLPHSEQLEELSRELRVINETLWQIKDDIRGADAAGDFGTSFTELAKSVYRTNDRRMEVKRRINTLLQSVIREENRYWPYGR